MRTRFPPSPTGFLHVGGLRTALFSYILARQTKGTFVLRIEDTDQERSVPGAVENILRTLHWAGIAPDEGVMMENEKVVQHGEYGPYIQSERLPLYREYADKLLASGHAYHCFCTSERLEQMRAEQAARKQAPMYDRTCCRLSAEEVQARLAKGEKHVIRLKIPREETITFKDDIRGEVSFMGSTVDDQVLLKSDGFPTYHLAHVVDDHLMKVDIVIRGEEWLSSLPKHIILFKALGWELPRYAHVPLLLNKDRSKLSKRQGDVAVEDYIKKGYLPETLINFLMLLGWNPGTTEELFSLDQLIEKFSLDRVQKAGAIFDTEKLDWMQGQWIRRLPLEEFAARIQPLVAEKYAAAGSDPNFQDKAKLIQERVTFFPEAVDMLAFFYETPQVTMELLANPKQKLTPDIVQKIMPELLALLEKIPENEWNEKRLDTDLRSLVQSGGYGLGQVFWPVRAALTGKPFSPGAFEVAAALGKAETLKRLQAAAQ